MAGVAVCTIFTANHLTRGRALERSLHQRHPDLDLFMLVADTPGAKAGKAIRATTVLGPTDVLTAPEIHRLRAQYDPTEYCAALRPSLLTYVLARGYDKVVYLDADVLVLGSLAGIFRDLDEASVLLTPHLLAPIPDDGMRPTEADVLAAGAFNAGFVAVADRPEARAFLAWWRGRAAAQGFGGGPGGPFTGQRWLDLAPGLFGGVEILRRPGCHVAYWNVHGRVVARDGDRWSVDGEELTFFHFSGFEPARPQALSRHQDRIRLADHPGLAALVAAYARTLAKLDFDGAAAKPYGFARFSNGVPFTPLCRQLVRRFPRIFERYPDPLDAKGPDAYFRWLQAPTWRAPDGMACSRYVQELYHARADLQARFPEPLGRDRERWLAWLQTPAAEVPAAFLERGPAGGARPRKPTVLVLGIFPFRVPFSGSQVRLHHIVRAYEAAGFEVQDIVLHEPGAYPPSHLGPHDFPFPRRSPYRQFEGRKARFIDGYAFGQYAAAEDGGLPDLLRRLPATVDVVHVEGLWMWAATRKLRQAPPCRNAVFVFGTENVEHALKRAIFEAHDHTDDRALEALAELETAACREADLTLAVTRAELAVFVGLGARRGVEAANGIAPWSATPAKLAEWRGRLPAGPWVLYVSSAHPPNVTGFADLIGDSLAFLPAETQLVLVGTAAAPVAERLLKAPDAALNRSRLQVLGVLPEADLAAVRTLAHAYILPIRDGGGSNLKTAEALYAGAYVVGTSTSFRGFEGTMGADRVRIADTSAGFRAAVAEVLGRERPGPLDAAADADRRALEWAGCLAPMTDAVLALLGRHDAVIG